MFACSIIYLLWLTTEMSFMPSFTELDKPFCMICISFSLRFLIVYKFTRFIIQMIFTWISRKMIWAVCLCCLLFGWYSLARLAITWIYAPIFMLNPTFFFVYENALLSWVLLFWNVKIVNSSVLSSFETGNAKNFNEV